MERGRRDYIDLDGALDMLEVGVETGDNDDTGQSSDGTKQGD